MSDADEIHKAIDTVLKGAPGNAISAAGVIAVSWPLSVYKLESGNICFYNEIYGNICGVSDLLDIGGAGVTEADGTIVLRLNDFQCVGRPIAGATSTVYGTPINVVATPTTGPAMLSVQSKLGVSTIDNNTVSDVLITVSSWGSNGKALGNVGFNWRCIVPISTRTN